MQESYGLNTAKHVLDSDTPDARNGVIGRFGRRWGTRAGSLKDYAIALGSPIYSLVDLKSGFCKENYFICRTGNGRIIIDPENLIDIPQVANLAGYWKFEESSGIIYDETANDNDGTYKEGSTKLLLHLNGNDGATSTVDSSNSGHTPIGFVGNAQLDTAQKKFGTASCLFDGNGDYITVPDSNDFNFYTSPFIIDLWVRYNSIDASGSSMVKQGSGGTWWQFNAVDTTIRFDTSTLSPVITASWTPVVDTWYHIALIRGWGGNVNDWAICVNGIALNTATASTTIPDAGGNLEIGGNSAAASQSIDGWIDELRITKGMVHWPANFVPETSEYDLTPSLYQRYGYMGSCLGYKGHYVEIADSASLRPAKLTIVAFVNRTITGIRHEIAAKIWEPTGAGDAGYEFLINSDNTLGFAYGNSSSMNTGISAGTISANWHHVAVTFDETDIRFYINGVLDTTINNPGNINYDTTNFYIGNSPDAGESTRGLDRFFFDGLIDEVMIWDVALTADEIASYLNWRYEL